jgi:hypothetical protein
MDKKQVIEKIRTLLTFNTDEPKKEDENTYAEVKTAEGATLRVEGEDVVIGEPVYLITDEGEVPAPEGDHALEDGRMIVVDELGVVVEIKEAEEEAEEVEEAPEQVEEEMSEEPISEETEVELAEETIPDVDAEINTPAVVGAETPEVEEITETIKDEVSEVVDHNDETRILTTRIDALEDLVRAMVDKQNNLIEASISMSNVLETYGNETTEKDIEVTKKSFSAIKEGKNTGFDSSLDAISKIRSSKK